MCLAVLLLLELHLSSLYVVDSAVLLLVVPWQLRRPAPALDALQLAQLSGELAQGMADACL